MDTFSMTRANEGAIRFCLHACQLLLQKLALITDPAEQLQEVTPANIVKDSATMSSSYSECLFVDTSRISFKRNPENYLRTPVRAIGCKYDAIGRQ